jgi:hypothetical protein
MVKLSEVEDIPYFKQFIERTEPILLQNLLNKCVRKCYIPLGFVFMQGDKVDGAYLIESG